MFLVSTLKGRANQRTGVGCDFQGTGKSISHFFNLDAILVMRRLACAYSSFLQAQKHDSRRTVVVDCSDETKLIRISTKICIDATKC
jgi:hypothetical protein